MIVVKLEMWPHGNEDRKYDLGRMYIANTGEHGNKNLGNYDAKVCRKGCYGFEDWDLIKATREGEVKDYPRLSYNIWRLIAKALLSCFPEERT